MSSFDWESFLRQWSEAILESMKAAQRTQLPPEVIASGWLGYPGATEAQICQTESRLGVQLPPSYREFLKVTNGWRQTTPFIHKLWSTEGIERFAVRHQKWIEAFTNHHENTQVNFEYAIELDELWNPPSIADEEYFVYGAAQDCSKLRVEYLKTALEISDVGEASIYLLNPQVVTADGEWEAWFFGDWLPGADRYPSFQDMMVAEYQNFLELCDSASVQTEALAEQVADSASSVSPESLATSHPAFTPEPQVTDALPQETVISGSEATAEEKPEIWRSRKRLLVEFQIRQIGEQVEYRTLTTAAGAQPESWLSLGAQELPQWLQDHLTDEVSHAVNSEPASLAPVEHPPIEPIEPLAAATPQPPLDLSLEIDHLMIRQEAHLAKPITICPGISESASWTAYDSLSSQQPVSFEVVFNLMGRSIDELSIQPVTYQTQFHVQNRTTGRWIALGATKPNSLNHDRQCYTAYLFGSTLEPGMYRLQVLTAL